jgi:hypothetical protein
MTTTQTPTLDWSTMTAAGIDTDSVHLVDPATTTELTYEAVYANGDMKVAFGECPDPDGEFGEGEHSGWTYTVFERYFDSWSMLQAGGYYAAHQLDDMLAAVARILAA